MMQDPGQSKTAPYTHPKVVRFTANIAETDGYIIVTPEYTHGTSRFF